jgi:hypothetical protein
MKPVYEALSTVYEALSSVYEALSSVYEARSHLWETRSLQLILCVVAEMAEAKAVRLGLIHRA